MRIEIGEDDRLAGMVEAAERGEPVEVTRAGAVVLRLNAERPLPLGRRTPLFDPAAWDELHTLTAPLRDGPSGAQVIRELRDMDD